MKKESNIFKKQMDEVINGTFNKNNHIIVLKNTPNILKEIGVIDYSITLTVNKLDRIMNESGKQSGEYHGLGNKTLENLPKAIQSPLKVIKSHNNSYVLVTNLKDKQNRPIIASIKISNGKKINTNVLTSAYGRNNYKDWLNKNYLAGNIIYEKNIH